MRLTSFGAVGVFEANDCGAPSMTTAAAAFPISLPLAPCPCRFFRSGGHPTDQRRLRFTDKFLIFASAIRAGKYSLAIIAILTASVSISYYQNSGDT